MEIQIIATNQLGLAQIQQIKTLENIVKRHDNTHKSVYLSNQFNENLDMPAFFLAYASERLVGVLTVYADEMPKAEITVFVHPQFRNQGIASQLKSRALAVLEQYGFNQVTFVVEKVFMENHPRITKNWHYHEEEVEYLLQLISLKDVQSSQEVQVRLATADDIDALANIQALAFESSVELGRQYVENALIDTEIELWSIIWRDEIVGTVSIDTTTDVDFYFGVAIHPSFQKQGIGKRALQSILQARQSKRVQQLQVEAENRAAIKLYEANGFDKISEIRYVIEKKVTL